MIDGWPIDEGELGAEWTTLATLAFGQFDVAEAYFATAAAGEPGLDRRAQGAYFLGGLSFYLSSALAWHVLRDQPVPALTMNQFGIMSDGANYLKFRYTNVAATDASPGAIVQNVLAPIVPRIKEATRLSDAAQWRIVADNLASGFLYVAKHLGCEARGVEIGRALVRDPAYRFFNGHTDYYDVDGQCFLKRGGCCRYYTADAGSYCATCILRPPAEHIPEIRRRYLAAAAE
jgi:hypothetical protein